MTTLKELNTASINYLRKHWDNGGTSEFDFSINDISRAKIDAIKDEFGDCYLFKINRYDGDEDKPFIVRYVGQKVYNFEYSGAIPVDDEKMLELLKDYAENSGFKEGKMMNKIEAIYNRIEELKGVSLIWS